MDPKVFDYHPIGTVVRFTPVEVDYIDKVRTIIPQAGRKEGIVVGLKDVPTGKYVPGGGGSPSSFVPWDHEYDPPYLAMDKKRTRLYRIRTCMTGREKLALPESIEVLDIKVTLPLKDYRRTK